MSWQYKTSLLFHAFHTGTTVNIQARQMQQWRAAARGLDVDGTGLGDGPPVR